ncbi:MAG: GNAT family N-acetyltransferase [Pseudomonadota bacterium]
MSLDSIRIEKQITDKGGRFVAHVSGETATGELTYSRVNDHLVIADHTGVPEILGGKGVGKALVEFLIQDARAQGYRIVPLCPFVRAQGAKHPEWNDVIIHK